MKQLLKGWELEVPFWLSGVSRGLFCFFFFNFYKETEYFNLPPQT